jgi:hypothetical protein
MGHPDGLDWSMLGRLGQGADDRRLLYLHVDVTLSHILMYLLTISCTAN